MGSPGQRVVERHLEGPVGRLSQVGPCLRVEQIGGRDIGQRLGRAHGGGVQRSGGVSVQVERSQLCVPVAQREGEHRDQPRLERAAGEVRESTVTTEVGDRDGFARPVRHEARPLPELGLQLLEQQRRLVRCRHVPRIRVRRDERHAGGRDGEDVDDAKHEVVEDPLDGKVRHERSGELTQHARELLLARHDPSFHLQARVAAGSGRCADRVLLNPSWENAKFR